MGGRMHIGELADRTGLSHRTIRHYEEVGILDPAERSEGGFRIYSRADEQRLLLIRRMKPLGYSLQEMIDLLRVVDTLDHDPLDAGARERLEQQRQEARERRARLGQQLVAADDFIARLEAL